MPGPLRIHLLARFEVWRNDTPIPPAEWRGQKTRDLLKILVLARGRLVSKDQLCDWLWPATEGAAAEANLRSAVSDLRKLLEPGLARGRDSAFILTRHEGYAFNLDGPVALDLVDFERGVQAADVSRPKLEAALALYGGDLLEEDPYAEWALRERDRLRELRLDALARLADACLDEADYPAAIAVCEQALALDAARETLWRSLMRALALNGDRAAALHTFDRCRAALARDLGVDPLPETLALHAQILRGEVMGGRPNPPAPFPIREGAQAVRLPSPERGAPPAGPTVARAGGGVWLYRLAAIGIVAWVALTGMGLGLSLAGLLRGTFVTSGDPGVEALPYLMSHPEARAEVYQQIHLFIPLGLLLLPGYLAWFAALRSTAQAQGRPVSAPAWLGVSLGGLEVVAQTLSRAVSLAQLSVLPSAYLNSAPDQRLVLITLWDVLRQFGSIFSTVSAVANPIAIGLLCWAARRHPRFSPLLTRSGVGLAGLTLFYSFFIPGAPLASVWLPLGLGLALATYAWLIGLAVTLWRA